MKVPFELIVQGGTLCTPGGRITADLGIREGRIAAKAELLARRPAKSVAAAIDAVADAFAQLSVGRADVPLRVPIGQAQHDSHTFFMPALLANSGALGLKVVSVFPHNQQRHALPSIHALVVLIDRDGRAALRSGPEMADAAWSLHAFVARVNGLLEIVR